MDVSCCHACSTFSLIILCQKPSNFEGTVSVGGRKICSFADNIDWIGVIGPQLVDLPTRLDNAATAYGMENSDVEQEVYTWTHSNTSQPPPQKMGNLKQKSKVDLPS